MNESLKDSIRKYEIEINQTNNDNTYSIKELNDKINALQMVILNKDNQINELKMLLIEYDSLKQDIANLKK